MPSDRGHSEPNLTGTPGSNYIGRGSSHRPQSRFKTEIRELNLEELDHEAQLDPEGFASKKIKTIFYEDQSRSIVSENDSPDLSFRYSLNPYRGCEHGCAYCYYSPA